MKKTILITGGCGFIGSHLVKNILELTEWDIVLLDRLDFSGSMDRVMDLEEYQTQKERVRFICWDLKAELNNLIINSIGQVDYIWHLASGSHVDRSIIDPLGFCMDNVVGTVNMLNYARKIKALQKFIYFSTDEVFGTAPQGVNYTEGSRHNAGNPYSASKAGAEDFCTAFANTYNLPIVITNTMNVFGLRQHPEKFIPLVVKSILNKKSIKIHDGSRFWISADNIFHGLYFVTCSTMETLDINDRSKGCFNLVGQKEVTNEELGCMISEILNCGALNYKVVTSVGQRPGHDKRYSLSGTKLKKIGFVYPKSFKASLSETILSMIKPENKKWL